MENNQKFVEQNNQKFIEQGIKREVRFAVVMYGGVSLAIYINGVAQELLKMCRATIADKKTVDLKSTERIYRKISALMANEKLIEHIARLLTEIAESGDTRAEIEQKEKMEREIEKLLDDLIADKKESSESRPLTKFVVDVLTGTSAGGINAIFLAKALANNQDITQLKNMWLDEGDIKVLINDKKSVEKTGLSVPNGAKSLLNSQRMYLKLLEAFDAMGKDNAEESMFTDEIDLFVPMTDFKGVVVPLRLLDKVVEEKRFGQVFQFRYKKGKADGNDFKKNNPMLAFAARATSSFPFAFEPMRLSQAYSVIAEGFEDWKEKITSLENSVEKYFPKILNKQCEKIVWTERDLVDGGILDNKPFGYAVDVLSERRADFLCERKLLFVEPSPENFNQTKTKEENIAPNVLQNAIASLSSIPSYETIREDLERLLDRNKLIERVTELIKKSEKDVFESLMKFPSAEKYSKESGGFWEKQGLEDVVQLKGRAVLPYYRLRIADLTDEIARLVSRIIGIEEDTENFLTIRIFVKAWRDDNFRFYRKTKTDKSDAPENTVLAFLRWYDLNYRLRRLRFVQEKAALLYRFDQGFREDLVLRKTDFEQIKTNLEQIEAKSLETVEISTETKAEKINKDEEHPFVEQSILISQATLDKLENAQPESKKSASKARKTELIEKKPSEIIWLISKQMEGEREIGVEKIRLTTNYFTTHLREVFKVMQTQREDLFSKQGQLSKNLSEIKITPENLEQVFKYFESKKKNYSSDIMTDKEFIRELKNDFSEVFGKIKAAADKLKGEMDSNLDLTRRQIKDIFEPDAENVPAALQNQGVEPVLFNAVKGFLKHYYDNFDEYDQISFPIFYETKVGEAVRVDVMRISPQDATGIIDERKEKRQKLAGESLFHFGAFLDRVWRFNDIMWGRLDGVERLITALLPDKKYEHLRTYLTKKAHLEILKEDLLSHKKEDIQNQLFKSLIEKSAGNNAEVGNVNSKSIAPELQNKIDNIVQNCLKPESAYQFIKDNHDAENRLDPKELLRVISRSTKVTGDIFEGIADKDSQIGSNLRWISRLGTIFWGLVEVAAPNSFWNLLFHHWLMLIYFFEVVLLVGSTIFVKPEIQQFATVSLILTLIIHLTAVTLGDYMRGGKFWSLIKFVAVGVFAVLTIAGGIFIFSFFYDNDLWETFEKLHKQFIEQKYYVKLFPIALLITIFASMLTWRETANVRVRFFGATSLVFVLLSVILGVVFYLLTKDAGKIDGLGAILSLEFVRSADDVIKIAGEFDSPLRSGLKWALAIDSFIFVPLYTGFLLIFCRLFNLRNWSWKNYLMRAASVCIIGTALADLSENLFTYSVLDTQKAFLQQWKINGIWISASVKWFLLSVTTAILSFIFWNKGWWTFFTVGFLFAAVCGIVGLFDHQLIQRFMTLQLSLLLVIGILFVIMPDKFKREF